MALFEHGGRLRNAAMQYGIPLTDWLDLSTGINPQGFIPLPLPLSTWQRLPENDDGLEAAASAYYGNASLLPLAGSQAAIQTLPRLFPPQDVAILTPTYSEHAAAWAAAGHRLQALPTLEAAVAQATIVVLCNPNNPSGRVVTPQQLSAAAQTLAQRGGWLLVDEAFIDANPALSLTPVAGQTLPNLIVLRSLGKFFGLAGARVGFAFATPTLLQQLAQALGPWPIAHPSRWVATAALTAAAWQNDARSHLHSASQRLAEILRPLGNSSGCALFQYVALAHAASIHAWLAQRGILTRLFDQPAALRFGLPGSEAEWHRLQEALQAWQTR